MNAVARRGVVQERISHAGLLNGSALLLNYAIESHGRIRAVR